MKTMNSLTFSARWVSFVIVAISMALFFGFGLYHLTKFETVDEHFWKYDRIGDYWDGWKQFAATRDVTKLKKTHINDKPGVTVALFSAPGFFLGPDPESHRIRDDTVTGEGLFTIYDITKTEHINLLLRLPILLVSTLMLPLLFWLIRAATRNNTIAALSILAIGTSPILIGMSQVINPDALLWSFFTGAIFSFAALLQTKEWKFLIITAVCTTLALLSKYTANILFFLFPLLFVMQLIFENTRSEDTQTAVRDFLKRYFFVVLGAGGMFSILMPAVFVRPKYLIEGTLGAPGFEHLFPILGVFLLILCIDTSIFQSRGTVYIHSLLSRFRFAIFRIITLSVLFLLIIPLVNVATGAKFIPLDNIKENAYSDGELSFDAFDSSIFPLRLLKEIGAESHTMVFTLSPIILVLLIILCISILIRTPKQKDWLLVFSFAFISIFILGALFSGVFLNARYMIVLYPILAFLTAVSISEFSEKFSRGLFFVKRTTISLSLVFFVTSFWSIWSIKPFFLNYTSTLLPKRFSISDAWGYGSYEAAAYLNTIPNIEEKTLWADRSGICQFVRARCINDYKIDLTHVIPDYFVITRRGALRRPFIWKDPSLAKKPSTEYYADAVKEWEWALFIDDRPENFIKVIPSEE